MLGLVPRDRIGPIVLPSILLDIRQAPAILIPGQGELLSSRKKRRPDSFTVLIKNSNSEMLLDLELQPTSSKDRIAPDNAPKDTLQEIPRMHRIFKQQYHYCFCGVPGKRDIIKEAHSWNFNRCFITCAEKERGCRFFQWIN